MNRRPLCMCFLFSFFLFCNGSCWNGRREGDGILHTLGIGVVLVLVLAFRERGRMVGWLVAGVGL